jgi:uncharacterized protein
MNRVFIDASFWIVYRDEDDARNPDAKRILTELFKRRTQFVITFPVVCEIHAYFTRLPLKRSQILKDFWNNPLVSIEDVSHQDQETAIELLQTHRDKNYSLCDATSFVVMRRMRVQRALSVDNHFRQFGEFEIIS